MLAWYTVTWFLDFVHHVVFLTGHSVAETGYLHSHLGLKRSVLNYCVASLIE